MTFFYSNKYDKNLVEIIQKSGYNVSSSGIDKILLKQSKKSYKRAYISNIIKATDSEKEKQHRLFCVQQRLVSLEYQNILNIGFS